jgi:hypothetical protein
LRRLLAVALLMALSCTSAPVPDVLAPDWSVIPPGLTEALCMRLRMDAIATGNVTIVKTTQPLATPHTVAALANIAKRRRKTRAMADAGNAAIVNRVIPVSLPTGTCSWTPIEVRDMARHADEMIVELSAPLPNPYEKGEAGVFARVSLAGENASWYWLPLVPQVTPEGTTWATGMPISLVI